jgi:pyruvate dehydrogenase E1 component alpha subunit
MPRILYQLPTQIEYLSILDPAGHADPELDPQLEPADLRRLYRAMVLARAWDEKMEILARQGRIGVYPPYKGQEAASLGPAFVMRKQDWLVPSFREMPAMLYVGWPLVRMILGWWGGHEYGAQTPPGLNILPLCGPVATQCPTAAGIAWGLKLRGDDAAVFCFVGDGGTSEGDFHETMNVAGVFRLPLVMIVQNNQWAISTPRSCQTASQTFAQKAVAYGVEGMQIDGNDLLAMIVGSREALARARDGGGPTLIEAVTYRLGPHSTTDDPRKYRTAEEERSWQARDPLTRFETYIESRGLLTQDEKRAVAAESREQIALALEQSQGYQADVHEPFRHCFSEIPPSLQLQATQFSEYLSRIEHPQARRGSVDTPAIAQAARILRPTAAGQVLQDSSMARQEADPPTEVGSTQDTSSRLRKTEAVPESHRSLDGAAVWSVSSIK